MTPMHDFTEIQNPAFLESVDSGFCPDSQTQSNQALGSDSRIRRILGWILWILEKARLHAGLQPVPESSSSPLPKGRESETPLARGSHSLSVRRRLACRMEVAA